MIQDELDTAKRLFDFDEIANFNEQHKIEVIRQDFEYWFMVNDKCYATAITFLGALSIGIRNYKLHNTK